LLSLQSEFQLTTVLIQLYIFTMWMYLIFHEDNILCAAFLHFNQIRIQFSRNTASSEKWLGKLSSHM